MQGENQNLKSLEVTDEQYSKILRFLEIEEENENDKKYKEQEKKNNNFVQLYKDHMPEVRWLMTKYPFANTMLFFILEHMDNRNALACSYSVFEDYFEKSRMTIYRAIKVLQENGFLDVYKMGTSNVYVINHDLAWTSYNTEKRYAKYDGKILISKKENKDYEYRNQFDRLKSLKERENL